MRRSVIIQFAILLLLPLSTVYAVRSLGRIRETIMNDLFREKMELVTHDDRLSPWALSGKVFKLTFVENVWIRDRYDNLELTVAADSDRCLYSVDLKPISSVYKLEWNKPAIPKNFETYDTKLVASFKKEVGLQKRVVRVVKSLLAKGLSCGKLKYVF